MCHCHAGRRWNTMASQSGDITEHHRMAAAPQAAIDETSWRYPGWRVVLVCFLSAVCCWGFGLYGHGVYLTELHRLYGWSASLISVGVTGFYILTAALVAFISEAVGRLGPKRVMLIGASSFGGAVALLSATNALWQLYLAYVLMAVGAATMHVGAISNVIGLWFEKKRALALSLALNGASSGGILVPAARRARHVWTVAAAFAMALTAQVGFLVHQIAILEPTIGRAQAGFSVAALTIAAIVGRFGLGAFAKLLDMRRFAAWSLASQAVAIAAMAATTNTTVL